MLKHAYDPFLRLSLKVPVLVIALALALVAFAGFRLFEAGRAFLPEFNEGSLTVSSVTIPGTSLEESDQLGTALERILLEVPEVVSTARRTGRSELDEHVQGVEAAETDVRLKMRDRPKEEVLEEIRQKVTLIPGTNVTVGQPISHRIDHMLSGVRANIAVKIFGQDLPTLRVLAEQVQEAMTGIPGVVDLSTEQQTDIPTLRVKVNPNAAARFGLQTGDASEAIETAYVGKEVSRVLEGQISFPLVVRYGTKENRSLTAIRNTLIDTPSGVRVPLTVVADIREDRGPNFIMREGVQRRIVVQCNVAGRDLASTVNEIRQRVSDQVPVPEGYRIEYGGQFESEQQATQTLLLLGGIAILGMVVLLTSAFHSFSDAIVILLNLPLALVGGVLGVYFGGGILSVASIIGFITLFGIATRNGIMLISHVRHLQREEGISDPREAIMLGSKERLIPILMTALSTGLALIPIALNQGEPGSEFHAPMAFVILFGLLSSTFLNMIVVPSIWLLTTQARKKV